MNYTQAQIDLANETDLAEFLQSRGEEVVRSGKEYRWKAHDSVTINNNQWFRHSENVGGYPVDFVMKFYGYSFSEAVEILLNQKGCISMNNETDAVNKNGKTKTPNPPPEFAELEDIPLEELENKKEENKFVLPEKADDCKIVTDYLVNERGIDEFTVNVFKSCGFVYEDAEHHNCVFVGFDNKWKPRYAHRRSTTDKIRLDVANSDKSYGFNTRKVDCDKLFVFEAPIDLMSFISLYYGTKAYPNCVALGGVSPKAMNRFLRDNPQVTKVYLCLDNDKAGNEASDSIAESLKESYSVGRVIPPGKKDWNDVLIEHNKNPDFDIKPIQVAINRIEPVKMITMADVEPEEVKYLWPNYIPFGKYSLLEGDSGLGKTTIAMQIIAACTTGTTLPEMDTPNEPFNCIYQTAEDGLADTIRPRLEKAGADLSRVFVIDDSDKPLTLDDERIGRAIRENNVKLLVIDPIQAYLGADKDMNRANEVRPVLSRLGKIAEETGCAILLIGHLNKNNYASASQRGLGSIDIIAAARSVLLVGAQKDDYNCRALCHIKSSLAPPSPSLSFTLGTEEGFKWNGVCDVTPDDLASGKEIKTETKKEKAKNLILRFLGEVEEMESEKLKTQVTSYNIGERTYYEAYSQLNKEGKILYFKEKDKWFVSINVPGLTNEEKTSFVKE
ncbi:MAG: AAA family ATPase [Clostridia bacterium]|nr:AAA family ATPase [Clostridia bacterium]